MDKRAECLFDLQRDLEKKRICEGCGRVNYAPHAGVVCCSGYRNWEITMARMTYAPLGTVEQTLHNKHKPH